MAESVGHVRHDPLQVAAALDRGGRLIPMLELCARCSALYRDLAALTAALPLGALPDRPRAFTLDEHEARRLRPRAWRAWWSAVGSARDTVTKPLAAGFTTLGLAGLLLTAIPAPTMGTGAAAASAPAVIGSARAAASPPQAKTPDSLAGAPSEEVATRRTAPDAPLGSTTLVVSAALLAAGGGLFVMRHAAVRGRAVP